MKKQFLAILTAFTLLIQGAILAAPISAEGATPTTTATAGIWNGSADTSWFDANSTTKTATLTTAEQLAGVTALNKQGQKFEGWTLKLGANIYLNEGNAADWATAAPANAWRPIQNFNGIFDGQGYTISGLYANASLQTDAGIGLFGWLNGATVRNLVITNSYLCSSKIVGSVAGYVRNNAATVENVYSDAILSVNATQDGALLGGIVGWLDLYQEQTPSLTMKNCWFAGSAVANSATDNWATRVGGLCGKSGGLLSCTDCLVTGSVEAQSQVGGFLGAVEGRGSAAFERCLMLGSVCSNRNNGNGAFTGQFIGILFNALTATVTNCYGLDDYAVSYTFANANKANEKAYYSANSTGKLTEDSTYFRVSRSALTGETAKTTLKSFDFDSVWSVASGTPTLTALSKARLTPVFGHLQSTTPDSTYSIRFITHLNTIPDRAGLTITAVTESGATVDLSTEATCVFTSLLAAENGTMATKTAYELGGRYLMALTVKDIPVSEGTVTFTVTPWVICDGVTYRGTTDTVGSDRGTVGGKA